jgi:transcriptional regulator with XRE-family HTH domain
MAELYSCKNDNSIPKCGIFCPFLGKKNHKKYYRKGQTYQMNKQTSLYNGPEQWLVNLNEYRIKVNMPLNEVAEKSNVSEKSVRRIFSGESKNPGVEPVRRIIRAMGCTINEIFEESGAVIGGQDLVTLQAKVDELSAELSLIQAENNVLKSKADALSAENDLLRLKLAHKEELLALHNYYNKLKPTE